MKYIRQFGIILVITFVGELLKAFLPLPIPASIYGLLLMLGLLITKIVPLEQVKEAGDFLIEIMPLMFIPAAAGILLSWNTMKEILIPLILITVITTILVMAATGKATELILNLGSAKSKETEDICHEESTM
ncbi:CidA/LrgA family protein [Velocimicrobium porci]|uniref:CidA/LrgA family protein n=1 Tax=Velocimicrobium porci TaxID=2606634 RepID=A0A6L5Y145_9FIRM|nr:CidA/LrgA family protein [Velocimicrobium porci]MSS64128.1 CidA/LrgA family protein [Velocimicrobium porci]